MDDARGRRQLPDGVQTPVAYLTCNFSEPALIDGKQRPALFTHDEVTTLFHEFGHGLHHMQTLVDELGVSGNTNNKKKTKKKPTQNKKNKNKKKNVLQHMTAHVDTGKPL